jgi:2-amino-4-hydroxy-6-hydroxymethyldihydropteridine diphosphokinase
MSSPAFRGDTPTTVLLSLGSNMGDRIHFIENALQYLLYTGTVANACVSSYYETEPVGYLDQGWFLNIALSGETTLSSRDFIACCKYIETLVGRKPRQPWHEREIDIDVLLFGNSILSEEYLSIPHPRMHLRRFVLMPASEIAAHAIHPSLNLSIGELLNSCTDFSIVRLRA